MFGLALLCEPVIVLAQGLPMSVQQNVASLLSNIIAGLNLLTWIAFFFLTILLDPNFIFDTGSSFDTMLNSIWILSRDLMNVLFAVILIFAAVYTVITAKKDFVTSNMSKFVLSVVLVNFSWFVPRLIIDVGSIAAATVYSIPSLILSEDSSRACNFPSSHPISGLQCDNPEPDRYVCECAMVTNVKFFLTQNQRAQFQGNGWTPILGDIMYVKMQPLDVNSVAGHSAVLNGLIVNHARLQGLATIPPAANGPQVNALLLFLMRELVVLVIHIALFFPLAGMLIAFAARIPVLWLTIAFMPFAVLKYAVPDMFSQYVGDYPQRLMDYFLKAAFLPAVVGIPLTIGFIMINAGANLTVSSELANRVSGLQIKITDDISDFWELLWLMMSLGVIWVGVFSMLEKMTPDFAKGAVNGVKGFGESLGKLALKAPLAAPILPGPAGQDKTTLLSAMKKFNPRAIDYQISNDPRGLASLGGGAGGGARGLEIDDASKKLKGKTDDQKKLAKSIEKLADEIAAGKDGRAEFTAVGTTSGVSGITAANSQATLKELIKKIEEKDGNTAEVQALKAQLARLDAAFAAHPPTP